MDRDATRTEVHQGKGKHKATCKNSIMELVDKTWYKEIKDPDTFYTNVTALKLLDHLNNLFLGLHTVYAVDIPQLMKTMFTNVDGIPQFLNGNGSGAAKVQAGETRIQD